MDRRHWFYFRSGECRDSLDASPNMPRGYFGCSDSRRNIGFHLVSAGIPDHAGRIGHRRAQSTAICRFAALSSCWRSDEPTREWQWVSIYFAPQSSSPSNMLHSHWFRKGDLVLLRAPSFVELSQRDRADSLYSDNHFSLPGLVIYGTFSDSMNIFQANKKVFQSGKFILTDSQRTSRCQAAMEITVKTGLLFTAVLIIFFLATGWQTVHRFCEEKDLQSGLLIGFAMLGFSWLGFMMAILPLTTGSYVFGYWEPRLFLPAIWTLALIAFCGLDRMFAMVEDRRLFRLGRYFALSLVLVQSALHVAFLWQVETL